MGGIFSKPKKVDAPPAPPIEPPLTIEDTGAGDAERKKIRRRKGRKDTFLTGDLVPSETGKKTKLG